MTSHTVMSGEEWIEARRRLLAKEKQFTRLRDELSRERRDLPWRRVEKAYVFEGAGGTETLADLFGDRSQLIVYHFMFDPEWTEGCKSCSLLADHYEPSVIHLAQRGVALVTVSRAPWEKLEAFRKRMGWTFKWVSSHACDFNRDYHVSFTPEEVAAKRMYYNYGMRAFPVAEAPGISVFVKDDAGVVYHTYSSYGRGLDMFLDVYHLLDIVPRGRDEEDLNYSMEWVRHHDRYGDASFVDPYVQLLTPKDD